MYTSRQKNQALDGTKFIFICPDRDLWITNTVPKETGLPSINKQSGLHTENWEYYSEISLTNS